MRNVLFEKFPISMHDQGEIEATLHDVLEALAVAGLDGAAEHLNAERAARKTRAAVEAARSDRDAAARSVGMPLRTARRLAKKAGKR